MADVVALKQWREQRQEVPALRRTEFRLSENCDLVEITLLDEAGNCEILEYALVSSPPNFDFGRLRHTWNEQVRRQLYDP